MNRKKRERLKTAVDFLEKAKDVVSDVRNDESYDFENLPENFQESDAGERMLEAIDLLDDTEASIDEAIDYLNEIA